MNSNVVFKQDLKGHFLHLIGLQSSKDQPNILADPVEADPVSYKKLSTVDFSSPLGQFIVDKKLANIFVSDDAAFDSRKSSFLQNRKKKPKTSSTFRGYRDKLAIKQPPHLFCFNPMKRIKGSLLDITNFAWSS